MVRERTRSKESNRYNEVKLTPQKDQDDEILANSTGRHTGSRAPTLNNISLIQNFKNSSGRYEEYHDDESEGNQNMKHQNYINIEQSGSDNSIDELDENLPERDDAGLQKSKRRGSDLQLLESI